MLNKLRKNLDPLLSKLGLIFASTGLSPNFWSVAALLISILAGIFYLSANFSFIENTYYMILTGGVLIIISGFFDMVDGSVARASHQITKKGAFLDSTFDKVAELWIFLAIAIGGLSNPVYCLIALGLSLIVSYTRSRAESLGIELKGIGIGERAERLVIIAVVGALPFSGAMEFAVIIVAIIAGITSLQRVFATVKNL